MANSGVVIASTTSTSNVSAVEKLRAKQMSSVRSALAPLTTALHGKDPASIVATVQADRDKWIQAISGQYMAIGTKFAGYAAANLAKRAGTSSFATDHPVYKSGVSAFIATYSGNQVPSYVALILKSFSANFKALQHKADGDPDPDDILDAANLMLAGNIAVLASNLGAMAGANAYSQITGVSVVKNWQALLDNHTRPDHEDADGQERDPEQPFDVGDEQLMFPLDASLGATDAQIAGCRCVVGFDVTSTLRSVRRLDWAERLASIARANLHLVGKAYNPDQPRDANGRWGSGGGDPAAAAARAVRALGSPPADVSQRGAYVGSVVQAAGGMRGPYATSSIYSKDGVYTADRQALHEQIADAYLAKYSDIPRDSQAIISGGLPGSGKTSALSNPDVQAALGVDTSQYMPINSDDFKELLANADGGYNQVDDLSPMEHAAFLHEEAGQIADDVASRAESEGMNVIHDITMGSPTSAGRRIDDLESHGYTVKGVFVDVDPDTAIGRATGRYERGASNYNSGSGNGGRYVPSSIIDSQRTPAGSDYSSVNRQYFEADKGSFNGGYVIIDNSGSKPIVLESKK